MKKIVLGTRVPNQYFAATGIGETDLGHGIDPWETGSYDLALEDAGIHNFNVVQYTSVIPKEAVKKSYEECKQYIHHGAVLETIMANVNGKKGDHICAGVVTAHVKHKDGTHIGGFACEYEGHAVKQTAKDILMESMEGLVYRRYKKDDVEIVDVDFTICDLVVKKKFGTVIAVLGFVTYIFPEIETS